MSENPPPAVNELGMRQMRRHVPKKKIPGRRRNPSLYRFSTPEDRAIRLAYQRDVASRSCCLASYWVEACTISHIVPDAVGLQQLCPSRCDAWRAIFETPTEMEPC